MIDRQESIGTLSQLLSEKQVKRLQLEVFASLNKKLLTVNDPELNQEFEQTYQLLVAIADGDASKERDFKRAFRTLSKHTRERYGFVAKGTLQSEYVAMGTGIGVALGAAFIPMNPAFIGIGIPIGVAIGVAIGQQKEKQAEEDGKIY